MKVRRTIDGKDLLEMFGIPSFRHMSKDKLASFVSALSDVDPEVAKKALEQFPDLSVAMASIVGHYRGIISECLASSDANERLCLEACCSAMDSIQCELEREELSSERREELIAQSVELVQMMREIATDSKRFRAHVIYISSVAVGFVTATLVSVLGSKADFAFPNLSKIAQRA